MRVRPVVAIAFAFGCALLPSQRALAGTKDAAPAQALFDEALKLATAGKYEAACPKYEESQRLDPALGTQFNLADCWEHVGRTATAWALFLEVESGARAAGKKARETSAHDRAAALEPKLSRLTIVVPVEARAPGLVVTRDGSSVGAGAWGEALPVDPGAHSIRASAPTKRAWSKDVNVGGDAAKLVVSVPALEDLPRDAPPIPDPSATTTSVPPGPPPSMSSDGSTQRTLGVVVAGVGVVGVGIGAFFGLSSMSKHDDAAKTCPSPSPCGDARAAQTWSDATSAGTISTIAFGVGAAALAGGLALWLTAPSSKTSVQAAPTVGGVIVRAQW